MTIDDSVGNAFRYYHVCFSLAHLEIQHRSIWRERQMSHTNKNLKSKRLPCGLLQYSLQIL